MATRPTMIQMATARTVGPLHFEDLEPKRFEDLVRQLAYEFKPWRRLEATGRAGSDDGFDARGYEIVQQATPATSRSEDGELEEDEAVLGERSNDRLWLIQCKREKSIGPKALAAYLDDITLGPEEQLHGLVFTAAADFSKKARDAFAEKCQAMGLEEWHLWGKAELEDRLFRPENDHLLFAYFGVSLTIRRRSQRSELRARLVMKRKAHRVLKDHPHSSLLLRSPDATDYPQMGDRTEFKKRPLWEMWPFRGFSHDGLRFCVRRHFAYLADDGKSWDAAMCFNDAQPSDHDDPWLGRDGHDDTRSKVLAFWETIPEADRAWLEVTAIVPYDDIIDIDELGDEYVNRPHIYVPFARSREGPFNGFVAEVQAIQRWEGRSFNPTSKDDGRVSFFPSTFREQDDDSD
jgi:hypothetical protein